MAAPQKHQTLPVSDISSVSAVVEKLDRVDEPLAYSVPLKLPDGKRTTIHIMVMPRHLTAARVAVFDAAEPLLHWCRRTQVHYAVTGGFFDRKTGQPLGKLWMRGLDIPSQPFGKHWAERRSGLWIEADTVRVVTVGELPAEPSGDFVTGLPALLRDGQVVATPDGDCEGLSETWQGEMDDDWSTWRAARNAVGYDRERIWSVVCDGPVTDPVWAKAVGALPSPDAGLYLWELADIFAALGATDAVNLDGGGGTTQVFEQEVVNRPLAGKYDTDYEPGHPMAEGRPIHTAIAFLPR